MVNNVEAETALIRERLFAGCLQLYDEPITFSAGDKADNKVNVELIRNNPDMRELVIPALSDLVMRHEPDFVVGVPNGATWLADAVAVETGCYLVHLHKDDDGAIDYEDPFLDYEVIATELLRGVLIEDVTRTLMNVRRSLAVRGLNQKITSVVTVLDRNPYSQRRIMPDQPLDPLIAEHIPEMLPADSPLRRLARAGINQ